MLVKPGTAFWPPKASYRDPHPYVVISEEIDGKVLTVNFTDIANYPSSTCIVDAAEYAPPLTKRSAVYYRNPYLWEVSRLEENLQKGDVLRQCPDVSPQLLKRIIDGARRTPDIDDPIKEKFGLLGGAVAANADILPGGVKKSPSQPPPLVIPSFKPRPATEKPE
jgi:hypothetical protein